MDKYLKANNRHKNSTIQPVVTKPTKTNTMAKQHTKNNNSNLSLRKILIIAMALMIIYVFLQTSAINKSKNQTTNHTNNYHLVNNILKNIEIEPLPDNSSNFLLKIQSEQNTNETDPIKKRNKHFYDVIDLILNQKADPSKDIYQIEYTSLETDKEMIYFRLDENLIKHIQNNDINSENLYHYCLDLRLDDSLK